MQCDYFDSGRCRSCGLMGTAYPDQLSAKDQRCRDVLADVAMDAQWLPPVASREEGFRNKAKLVVAGTRGGVTVGILDGLGRGVDLRSCGLHEAGLATAIGVLAGLLDEIGLEPYDIIARRGELKHVILTHSPDDELMLRLVLRSRRHEALLRSRLGMLRSALPGLVVVSLNLQPEHKAILEGEQEIILTDQDRLPMRVDGVTLNLRPNSFFQTNTAVAAALYRQAGDWVVETAPSSVWDLYCGVGGFALQAALRAADSVRTVVGIEVSREAVVSAQLSAAELAASHPGAVTPDFRVGDATAIDDTTAPELVIVNPPRRGIGPELAAWLDASEVRHVIYSSCNVESLARDLRAMPNFVTREARLFDMFPQTNHHEVMVRLHRKVPIA